MNGNETLGGFIMKKVFRYIHKQGILIPCLVVTALMAVTQILNGYETYVIKEAFSSIGTNTLMPSILLMVSVLLGAIFVDKVRTYFQSKLKCNFVYKRRISLYDKLLHLSYKEMSDIDISNCVDVINKIEDNVDIIVYVPQQMATIAASFIVAEVLLFRENKILTITITLLLCILMIIYKRMNTRISSLYSVKKECRVRCIMAVSKLLSYDIIKSCCHEKDEAEKFNNLSEDFRKADFNKKMAVCNTQIFTRLFATIIILVVSITIMVTSSDTTQAFAEGFMFYNLVDKLASALLDVSNLIDNIGNAGIALDSEHKLDMLAIEEDGTVTLDKFESSIELKNVGFKYSDSDTILSGVSLKIPKGTKVGIYGPSGGGKSSLVKLLQKQYAATEGEILIDGINILDLTNKSLRSRIGVVSQDITLFSDMSIKENIRYGKPCATDAEIIKASELANAHGFISNFKDGYDSLIGNNGIKLSGGQKQRIAIARLFLANPEILILDEATSKLDNESEAEVQKAIEKLSSDKTVISIAHRLSTIENSDMLVGIQEHKVYEVGTNESLMKTGSLWSQLHK